VKLESPSILTRKIFFARLLGNGAAGNFLVNPISGGGGVPPSALAAPVHSSRKHYESSLVSVLATACTFIAFYWNKATKQ